MGPKAKVRKELRPWAKLIEDGKRVTGYTLTRHQESHLVDIFHKTHTSEEFFDRFFRNDVLRMRREALDMGDVFSCRRQILNTADLCLVKASFPKLISRNLKKMMAYTWRHMIRTGKDCYQYLAEDRRCQKDREKWIECVEGFETIVELLWAVQQEGVPDLEELMLASQVNPRPLEVNTIKRMTNILPFQHPDPLCS